MLAVAYMHGPADDTVKLSYLDLLVKWDSFKPQARHAAGMPLLALIIGWTFISKVALA